MSQPDSVDQSYGSLDPQWAAANGIRVVADYLSHDPAKDWTAPQIQAYHAAGVGCEFLWESTANRALSGYGAGFADGSDGAGHLTTLIGQVGYAPENSLAIIAAYDFDTNPSQYPVIDAYAGAFKAGLAGRFLAGAYGEADLIDHLFAVGLIDVGYQTYAWSNGRVSARADLYQYLINQTLNGTSVDFNRIIDAAGLGAWWPKGHSPSGGGTPITGDHMPQELIQLNPAPDVPAGVQTGIFLRAPGSPQFDHMGDPNVVNYYINGRQKLVLSVVSYTEFFILESEAARVAAAIASVIPTGPQGPPGPAGSGGTTGPLNITLTGTGTPA